MHPALPLLLLLTAAPDRVRYSKPEGPAEPTPESVALVRWQAGDRAFIAVDEANLRSAASAVAPALARLAMGSTVQVVRAHGEPVREQDRVDLWYEVTVGAQKGFVFGNVLTPFAFVDDLDGDAEKEIATVAMTADFKIRVRVLDPSVTGTSRVTWLDLEPTGGAYVSRTGGDAVAALVPKAQAGASLVRVEASVEACADYRHSWVSYTATAGKLGALKVALQESGLSDPPVTAEFKVKFSPGKAVVVRTSQNDEEEGAGQTTTARFTLKDGVFVEDKAPAKR